MCLICADVFRYLRHGSQPEDYAAIKDMPQLQPFWAAGFSFSRGHFKVQVPYDAYQPMVFQGEEIAIGIRGFTYGKNTSSMHARTSSSVNCVSYCLQLHQW